MPQTNVEELLFRKCYEASGTKVTNCLVHADRPLTERLFNCGACCADVQNRLRDCIVVNQWLNKWKDEASEILRAQVFPRTELQQAYERFRDSFRADGHNNQPELLAEANDGFRRAFTAAFAAMDQKRPTT